MISAKGANGQAYLDGDKVTITRKGLLASSVGFFKGDMTIPVSAISAVELREPHFGVNGYIYFHYAGAKPALPMVKKECDENCIVFGKSASPEFVALKKAIDQKMLELQNPQGFNNSSDPIDQIKKLSALLNSGIISKDEFEQKKCELLSRI